MHEHTNTVQDSLTGLGQNTVITVCSLINYSMISFQLMQSLCLWSVWLQSQHNSKRTWRQKPKTYLMSGKVRMVVILWPSGWPPKHKPSLSVVFFACYCQGYFLPCHPLTRPCTFGNGHVCVHTMYMPREIRGPVHCWVDGQEALSIASKTTEAGVTIHVHQPQSW